MSNPKRILVTGAGGFIGHHLVTYLRKMGHFVRGVDIKYPEFTDTDADEFEILDLRRWDNCLQATRNMDEVYTLAADMGGMGFISCNHATILHNNALINFHIIDAARVNGIKKLLYTSSACVYPEFKQTETDSAPLKEEDAYPAMPQDAYGWEKLITEIFCHHYTNDFGLDTRVVRFHNIYGPNGTWEGGREKAPAALCRKIAYAKLTGNHEIDIWGDGLQTRSFCHIDDCLKGLHLIMESDHHDPINLGRDELTTINHLADIIAGIAGIEITKRHVEGPQGVRGRNSDNSMTMKVIGWAPEIDLQEGLAMTYPWIEEQVRLKLERGE